MSKKDSDLTPYFADYFLMKLCQFMEVASHEANKEKADILKNYSKLIIHYITTNQHIFDEMNESNTESQITI